MQSRNGKPRVAPAARRNVRRERCFFVMNMAENCGRVYHKQVAGVQTSIVTFNPLFFNTSSP